MEKQNKLFGRGSSSKETSEELFKKGESMIQSGDLTAALSFFHQMLQQAESEGAGSQMRNRLYNLSAFIHDSAVKLNAQAGGNIYFSAGLAELDAEISISKMLLEYEPEAADIYSSLGLAYDNRGYCEKAEQYYRQAIKLDPGGIIAADAWMNIGILYMNCAKTITGKEPGGKEKEISIAGLRKEQLFPAKESAVAIHLNADSPLWKTAESAFEQALSIYTKAALGNVQFKHDLANAHWNLAQLYTNLLQGSKAILHVQSVYHLEPENKKAIDWLKEAERNTGKELLI